MDTTIRFPCILNRFPELLNDRTKVETSSNQALSQILQQFSPPCIEVKQLPVQTLMREELQLPKFLLREVRNVIHKST